MAKINQDVAEIVEAVVVVELKNAIVMETVQSNPLHLKFNSIEEEIRTFAKQNHVPIILDEGLAFLEQIIRIAQPKRILEIGTAIGYSAIRMQQVCDSEVVTIERNPQMITEAEKNIERMHLSSKITVLKVDALEAFDLIQGTTFDLIFIDAAKAQYQKFFEIYTPLLSSHGIVITDNMSFHGLVHTEDLQNQSRAVRGLIRKLGKYHQFLDNHSDFITSVFEIGDGVALSIKKG